MTTNIEQLRLSSQTLTGNCSGVSFLFDDNGLVYVGEGWNCLLRVAEYTRKDSDKIFTKWNFIKIENENERKRVEQELRRKVKPKYNKV
jgi:excinuclease UvrABC nuclease subunit